MSFLMWDRTVVFVIMGSKEFREFVRRFSLVSKTNIGMG